MHIGDAANGIGNEKSRLRGILQDVDIRLLYASHNDLPPGAWNHDWLPNDFWRLYRNDAPGGVLTFQNEPMELIPGAVYVVPSGFQLSSRNTGRIRHFFVHFDLRGVPPLAFRDLFPGPIHVDAGALFRESVAVVGDKVAALPMDDIAAQCQIKAIIYLALGYYLEHLPDEIAEISWRRLQAMQPVMPAMRLIECQLEQSLSNRDLAGACAMSENQFIRRFRQAVGFTPATFIQQKRLAAAAQLLLYTDDPIDSIALKTGFADRFYLSRVFRRAMGLPPAAYRRLPRS